MAGDRATDVGERLVLRRNALGLTQDAVVARMAPRMRAGKMTAWSRESLSGMETGKTELSLDLFHELASILDTTPQWLLAGDAAGDTELVAMIRAIDTDPDFDEAARVVVMTVASAEYEQSKKRASGALSEDEAEMLRLYRAASETARSLTRAGLQSDTEQRPGRRTARQAGSTRRELSA